MVLTLRPLTRVSVCAYLIFSWILLAASLIRQFLLISTVSSFIINETQTQWNSVDFPVLLVVVWTLMQTSVEANVTVAVLITVKWIEHPFHLQTVLHTTYWLCAETLLSHVCLMCLYIQFVSVCSVCVLHFLAFSWLYWPNSLRDDRQCDVRFGGLWTWTAAQDAASVHGLHWLSLRDTQGTSESHKSAYLTVLILLKTPLLP